MKLCYLGASHWDQIDSHYHASPVPLLRMPPHRYLNMVYSWAIERIASDKLDEWIDELHELLPWQDINSEAAVNIESDSFFAMQAKGGR